MHYPVVKGFVLLDQKQQNTVIPPPIPHPETQGPVGQMPSEMQRRVYPRQWIQKGGIKKS